MASAAGVCAIACPANTQNGAGRQWSRNATHQWSWDRHHFVKDAQRKGMYRQVQVGMTQYFQEQRWGTYYINVCMRNGELGHSGVLHRWSDCVSLPRNSRLD